MTAPTIKNYVAGRWLSPAAARALDVVNPATAEILAHVPLSTAGDVDVAVKAAQSAFWAWRSTPPVVRARYLFRLKALLDDHAEELARIVTQEEGKVFSDARGEVQRGIECVEVATGIPSLMQGANLEDVAKDIDTDSYRQPVGVAAIIAPFNFPFMVPLWFLPFAAACGNTVIIKPSEQVPLSQQRLVELVHEAGFPAGVVNLVNGDKEAVDAILAHPGVNAVSFVGSAPTAQYVYRTAAQHGKRAQCLGGAKNFMVVMPDAVLERTVDAILSSAFGAAGERCLAGSVVLNVGGVGEKLTAMLVKAAGAMKVGYGLDAGVEMGPLVSRKHKARVVDYIGKGMAEGAHLLLDGRDCRVAGCPDGAFVGPTIFGNVRPQMAIANDEIFGPVLSVIDVPDFDAAMSIIDSNPFGNAAAIFTQSGKWAREFRYRVQAGMVGVNIGVPAPMAFFTFTGWKKSFFGDLHGHGRDSIEFFTEKKVLISRWF